MDPFLWFRVESVLCFQFNHHIDGRTILAASGEHWLYKDLERETVYCHVLARRYSLHYTRGSQLYDWNFSLGPWVAGVRQNTLTALAVSWELISAATPGSRGKQ